MHCLGHFVWKSQGEELKLMAAFPQQLAGIYHHIAVAIAETVAATVSIVAIAAAVAALNIDAADYR